MGLCRSAVTMEGEAADDDLTPRLWFSDGHSLLSAGGDKVAASGCASVKVTDLFCSVGGHKDNKLRQQVHVILARLFSRTLAKTTLLCTCAPCICSVLVIFATPRQSTAHVQSSADCKDSCKHGKQTGRSQLLRILALEQYQ